MDNIMRYSNHKPLVSALSGILERLRSDDERSADVRNTPDDQAPRRPAPHIDRLTPDQRQTIFTSYRAGIGPRTLAQQFGVTERAIKYLVKKHGVRPDLPDRRNGGSRNGPS